MAGAGFKTFNTGDVLTASDVNTYLMQQTVMVFADTTARSTALGANVAEGMLSYLKDTNTTAYYDGSAWQTLSTGGDITSVVAGTGLTGGGTSGDVTLSINTTTANTWSAAQTATSFIVTGSSVPANGMYLPAANTLALSSNTTERVRISTGGLVLINTTSTTLGTGSAASQLGIVAAASTTVGAVIRGAASQTANLLEAQDSSGTMIAAINSAGEFQTKSNSNQYMVIQNKTTGTTGNYGLYMDSTNNQLIIYTASAPRMTVTGAGNVYIPGRIGLGAGITTTYQTRITNNQSASDITLATTNYASQTADSIAVQNSAASLIWGVSAAGLMKYISGNTATTVGAAGGASALPATPTGYLKIDIGGTEYKVPYYAA